MSALTFALRAPPPERLDLSALKPSRLAPLSVAEIERLPVGTGRQGLVVGDLFAVADGERDTIRFDGGSDRLDRVGEELDGGSVLVEGDVGQRLAFAMTGGEVRVAGSAGPFAASAAKGGLVAISGDAGERAGGAVHGAMHGLDGATLVVSGNVGERLGDRMRRGLVLVAGSAGDFAGSRMIAGTLVARAVGDHPGYLMRRGTIIAGDAGALLPSFVATGPHRLVALSLIRRAVAAIDPGLAAMIPDVVLRQAGDLATLGKGEILLPAKGAR